jgi:hypothetical protein
MWMQLHLGVQVSADAAQVMIGLARRLPDGEFRDAVNAMLIREAALAQDAGTYPPALITAIAELDAATQDRPGTGLRVDPGDDGTLRAVPEKKLPDRAAYQQLLTRVQGGTAPMADIAMSSLAASVLTLYSGSGSATAGKRGSGGRD